MGPPRSEVADEAVVVCADQRGPESVVHAIVTAVAERDGISPLELSPLAQYVDPDALEALFDHARDRNRETRVEFVYEGYRIIATTERDCP